MRPFILSAVLLSTSVLGGVAHAQNYVPARSYNNPDVVVNMDTLGVSNSPYKPTPSYQAPNAPVLAPVMSRPLPPLRPPAANPQLADRAPMPIAPRGAIPPSLPGFSARSMAMAAPMPVVPMAAPMVAASAPAAIPAPAKITDKNEPARELLAAARDEAATAKPRDVVIFDEPAAKVEEKAPVVAEAELKPTPLPAKATKASKPPMDLTTPPAMIKEIADDVVAEKPAAMPEPVKAAPIQTAMLKPEPISETASGVSGATLVDDFEAYRLLFGAKSAKLDVSETAVLDKVIGKLKDEPAARLQLRAYADGTPDTASGARRLSLSRALQVRSYLTQKGIVSSRLDVRALGLGNAAMGDAVNRDAIPADRVDIIFVR